MPKYSFECTNCNKSFSKIIEYSALNTVHCPFCNHSSPNRSFGFVGSTIERTKEEIKDMIKDDAKKIAKKIKQGDQNAISEIYGEVK